MADEKNWDANRKVDAPEAVNDGQSDEDAQAQTVADEALAAHRSRRGEPLDDSLDASVSEKADSGDEDDDVQDLVDHIDQMESSGQIDNDAFRGERNDDDEEGSLGRGGVERDAPRGAE